MLLDQVLICVRLESFCTRRCTCSWPLRVGWLRVARAALVAPLAMDSDPVTHSLRVDKAGLDHAEPVLATGGR